MEPLLVLITAVLVLATAIIGFLAKLDKDVGEVHVMVNNRMSEALARIDQLIEALGAAGIAVPDKPERDE